MANKILSALNQAMNMVDTKVRDPMVNGLASMSRNVGSKIKSAQDQAYQAYWAKRPQAPLLHPLVAADDAIGQDFLKRGFVAQGGGTFVKRDPSTGKISTITNAGGKLPQNNTPQINQVTPTSPITPVQQGNITDTFKFQMGQNKYPDAKRQLQAMYQAKGNPPMAQYTDQFVAMGEKYKVDPRILATIAQIESSGGRNYPTQSNNPFGYLGGTGNTVAERLNAGFTSVPHAIEALTRRFSTRYPDFIKNPTPSQLQQSYNATPSERQRYIDLMTEILPYMQ
jgi:hypothetical protein